MKQKQEIRGSVIIFIGIIAAVGLFAGCAAPTQMRARPPGGAVGGPAGISGVEDEIEKLVPGRILFNPPEKMKVGVRERVEVRITRSFTHDLTRALKGSGKPQIEQIKIGAYMAANLIGQNFEITSLNNEEQVVVGSGFTQWAWDVVPLRSGVQPLLLRVTVRLKIPEVGEEKKDLPVFEREIKVAVNPVYSAAKFVENYWQWIITVILIPVAGWLISLWIKLRKNKKKE
jgi:hypothetical protein